MLNSSRCFKTKPGENSKEFCHHQGVLRPLDIVCLLPSAAYQALVRSGWERGMSEVVDDNYGQQAHAVCKSVIEEGGRVAVAVLVVVGGGSGGGSWWQCWWWLVARQASTSSLRQFARAWSPLRASGHCLQEPRQVFEIPYIKSDRWHFWTLCDGFSSNKKWNIYYQLLMWHIFQLPGIHSSGQDYSTLTYKTSQWSFSSPCSPLSLFASFHLDLQLLNMGEVKKTTFTWTISRAASELVQQEWPKAWVILGWLVKN